MNRPRIDGPGVEGSGAAWQAGGWGVGERISDEVYECAGCAGKVPVVDAVWLPEPRPSEVDASKARPYCCRECFEAHQKEVHPVDDLAALRTRADTLAAEVGRLRRALEDIAAMRTWAGVWHPNCECGKRLPQIFDKADAALAALRAGEADGVEVGEKGAVV